MDMKSYINVKTNQTLKNSKVQLKMYVKYIAHAKKIVIARGSGSNCAIRRQWLPYGIKLSIKAIGK